MINEFLFNSFMQIAINFFLVPQIVHNVLRGRMMDFDANYIIFFMCTRSLLPVPNDFSIEYKILLKLDLFQRLSREYF